MEPIKLVTQNDAYIAHAAKHFPAMLEAMRAVAHCESSVRALLKDHLDAWSKFHRAIAAAKTLQAGDFMEDGTGTPNGILGIVGPKCLRCGDTKIVVRYKGDSVEKPKLCPCLRVGDVVGPDVANLLPLGSQFEFLFDTGVWTREERGWANKDHSGHVGEWFLAGKDYRILRIGPAPATQPDICEEWAREIHEEWAQEIQAKRYSSAGKTTDILRRLGLDKVQAAIEAGKRCRNRIYGVAGSETYYKLSRDALDALLNALDAIDAKAGGR